MSLPKILIEIIRGDPGATVRISTEQGLGFLLQFKATDVKVIDSERKGPSGYFVAHDPHQNRHLVPGIARLPRGWRLVPNSNPTYYDEHGNLLERYWKIPVRTQAWLDAWPHESTAKRGELVKFIGGD